MLESEVNVQSGSQPVKLLGRTGKCLETVAPCFGDLLFVVCFYLLRESLRTFQVMMVGFFKDVIIGIVVTPWAIPIGLDFGTTTVMEECSTIALIQSSLDSLVAVVPAATRLLPVLAPLCK